VNWNMFGPQQQGFRMPQRMPMGYQAPQQGLQMPNIMAPGPAAAQQGLQVPTGLAAEMNAPLQKYAQPSTGMNPMAMMQLMNMGMKMSEQQPQAPLPPAYRAPMPELSPYRRFSLFGR
jgi:hypothetical protein